MPGSSSCQCPLETAVDKSVQLESASPYVVTDGALRSISSCQLNKPSVTFNLASDMTSHKRDSVRKNTGGSYDGGLERILEDQVSSPSLQSLPSQVERSLSYSCAESSNSNANLNSDSGEDRTQSGDHPADGVDASDVNCNPLTSDEDGVARQSGAEEVEVNFSQNASSGEPPDTSSGDVGKLPLAHTKPLCLPLSFPFLKKSSGGKDKNLNEKPSNISPRGRPSRPAPKQSWLLRLFESKMFSIDIAIQYLYNSKEPGVQTYIGEYTATLQYIYK